MTVESKGITVIVDAGSGLMMLEKELREAGPDRLKKSKFNVLISHLHLDHIIGFGTFSPVWDKDSDMRIFTCVRDERPLKEQVFGVFKPPYWPGSLVDVSQAQCVPVESGVTFNIGHLAVTPFRANHPDITLSFYISDGEKSFVHLLDNEISGMEGQAYNKLLKLCSGADLVVFDSAYSKEDYSRFKGWGHSTVEQGVMLARQCRPKRMMFSHFGQQYSDEQIDGWARFFEGETCCEFILGSDREIIDL
ncbi:MAG: MBL fold metallo-hydrolase [Defluviitaleaceae bacterium]|nr:MBL fold metallo-hydrolase [Defluviitaleaceae bacterium]